VYNREKSKILTLVASGARTATVASEGSGIFGQYDDLLLCLKITAATSTSTILLSYQVSFDQGVTWLTHSSMTVSAGGGAAENIFLNVTACGSMGRVNCVYGGAGTITFAVYADLKKHG
jgi:hypothetical protein